MKSFLMQHGKEPEFHYACYKQRALYMTELLVFNFETEKYFDK